MTQVGTWADALKIARSGTLFMMVSNPSGVGRSVLQIADVRVIPDQLLDRWQRQVGALELPIDLATVAATLPYGKVTSRATKGGLNVVDDASGQTCVIVNAAIIVRLPL